MTPTTSLELADLMLDQAEVAAVPGEAFGPSGYLRFSYALGDDAAPRGRAAAAEALRLVLTPSVRPAGSCGGSDVPAPGTDDVAVADR